MSIYFDNNSTTKPCEKALEAMNTCLREVYGNPSSMHALGNSAREKLSQLRRKIAASIHAKEDEIIFVASGSEANNTCIKGFCHSAGTQKKNHIITTAIEHPSVLKTFEQLKEEGFKVTYLPVDENGFVQPATLMDAVRDETLLVSIAHSNNEIGTIQNIKELRALIPDIVFHTDAVQSFKKVPFDVRDNKVDLASFSGHKIHAPKGIGFIYKRDGIGIKPIISGGSQEFGIRAGTENIAFIAALAAAIDDMDETDIARMKSLQKMLLDGLHKFEGVKINGPENPDYRNCTNVSVSFSGHEAEAIVKYMNDRGIYVSTRSACSSNSKQVSHVLTAISLGPQYIHGTVRIGLSKYSTEEEVHTFLDCLKEYMSKNKPYPINTI